MNENKINMTEIVDRHLLLKNGSIAITHDGWSSCATESYSTFHQKCLGVATSCPAYTSGSGGPIPVKRLQMDLKVFSVILKC